MKGFLVLLLTTSAALASPQYNYPQPSNAGGLISGFTGGATGHIGGGSIGHGSTGGFSAGGSYSGGAASGGFSAVNSGSGYSHGAAAAGGHEAIVTKQFLIHSAPHEQDEHGADKVINLGPARKNYRVVFIKAPHQGVQAGKVRFVAPANEEKTVIYVLSKKTDAADIQADVQQAHSEPTKPEVHFIKYKTHEEALHAQRTIQAQFDALEGKSQISDEGVAPLTSVIGALGDGSAHDGSGAAHGGAAAGGYSAGGISSGGSFGATGAGASGSYLPPSH